MNVGGDFGASRGPAVGGAGDVGGAGASDASGFEGAAQAPSGSQVGGAASAGSRVDVGANVGGAAGVAGGGGGARSVQSGGFSDSADVDVDVPRGSELTGGAERSVGDSRHQVAGGQGEAGFYDAVGPDGKSAVKGGAVATGEGHVESGLYDHDMSREGKHAMHVEGLQGRASAEGSVSAAAGETGYRNPTEEAARADQLELNERDRALGRLDHAQDQKASATAAVGDPSGTAKGAATDAGMSEARERSPIDPGEARANVSTASDVVRDPASAGEAHAEVEVDAKVRGVDPTKKK
jgi:hypothetical protein